MADFSMLIGGQLEPGTGDIEVLNPADESVVGAAPDARSEDVDKAVAAAREAFAAWQHTTIEQRLETLSKIADAIEANAEELVTLLVREQGKPMAVAQFELLLLGMPVLRGLNGKALEPRVIEDSAERKAILYRKPLGVVAGIVPWNFPIAIAIIKIAHALLTGNTIVVKPSPFTPLATLRLGELIHDIVPAGVINIISGGDQVGPMLTAHPDVDKISFTGSTAVGKAIMRGAADDLKRLTLEMGGNDAAIVLDDADVAKIIEPIFQSAFINSGQTCAAIKRLYVHDSLYDAVVGGLAAVASQVKLGNGLEPDTVLGPIQNRPQYEKVLSVLEETKASGARIVAGGQALPGKGYFIQPTIVADAEEGMTVVDEETFGPVLPVLRYSDIEDAIARANGTSYGLDASVWGEDVERAAAIAERLECGTAGVNKHIDLCPNIPFGGAKHSGVGSEFGDEGLHEFTQVRVVNIAPA
jgi:acyl-CoA reductase-like NAD-dependent aldehyde dehydrogenase